MHRSIDTPQGPESTLERLLKEGRAYGFMQTVDVLAAHRPDAPPPGGRGPYAQEAVHFLHDAALSFGEGEVSQVKARDTNTFEVTSRFLGATGSASPLSHYLIEALAIPGEEGDASRSYLDIFHHRLYGLHYRGQAELDIARPKDRLWLDRLACLLGLAPEMRASLAQLSHLELLRLAPLLGCHAKSVDAVEQGINLLLSDYLRNPDGPSAKATIHDFEGSWTAIDEDALLRLGRKNHGLGLVSLVGKRIKHRAAGARVEIATLHPSQQRHYEPSGTAYQKLAHLLALCIRAPIEFELDLKIRYRAQDHCTLGSSRLKVDAVLPGSNRAPHRRILRKLDIPCYQRT